MDSILDGLDGSDEMKAEMKQVMDTLVIEFKGAGLSHGETQRRLHDAMGAVMSKHMSGPAAAPSLDSLASGEYTSSWEARARRGWRPSRQRLCIAWCLR